MSAPLPAHPITVFLQVWQLVMYVGMLLFTVCWFIWDWDSMTLMLLIPLALTCATVAAVLQARRVRS